MSDGYPRTGPDDGRFSDHFGSLQSIVTSAAQNDSGMFETNLRDERYLPFDGSGVISEWQLELLADLPLFDYDTITDVILHIRYTAREGGVPLRTGAAKNLTELIGNGQAAGSMRLFSIRHEFPSEWAKFKRAQLAGQTPTAALTIELRKEHYPFWSKGKLNKVTRADLFASGIPSLVCYERADSTGDRVSLEPGTDLPLPAAQLARLTPQTPVGTLTLHLSSNAVDDLWLAIAWKS